MPIFLIGALANALRGGQHKKYFPFLNKIAQHSKEPGSSNVEKALGRLVDGDVLNSTLYALFILTYTQNLLLAVLSWAAMHVGAGIGWEDYIQATWNVMRKNYKRRKHLGWLEKPFEWLYRRHEQWWGVIMLTIRGGIWGALLSLPLLSAEPLFFSLGMGMVYFICAALVQPIDRRRDVAEAIYGALLWAGPWLAVSF